MNLKFCRLARNLRQVDLAKKVGIHAPNLSLIENGLAKPSQATKVKIEKALQMPGWIDWEATARREKIGG